MSLYITSISPSFPFVSSKGLDFQGSFQQIPLGRDIPQAAIDVAQVQQRVGHRPMVMASEEENPIKRNQLPLKQTE